MNAFHIKLLAILLMIIDHVGVFFYPDQLIFRVIGRLAFPLFAWLIANGARHTHDIKAYTIRIFVLAVIAQIPYDATNQLVHIPHAAYNVLFTLGLGLLAIVLIKKTHNRQLWLLITVICTAVAVLMQTDYGTFGVFSIVCFYLFFNNFRYLFISQLIIYLVPFLFLSGYKTFPIEPLALCALVFIRLYNKKEGIKAKYLFYIFYPLQYAIIYVLKLWG